MFVPALAAVFFLACTTAANAELPAKRAASANALDEVFAPTDLAGLRRKLNRRVVVEGTITGSGKSKTGSVRYLNFTRNYRDSVSLVFVAGRNREEFPEERLKEFIGKKVHVGGLVSERGGALQMRVFELEHIRLLP
jgi:hypothetical protein